MPSNYEHVLQTGSGWTKAILRFEEKGQTTTYFDSRWMGSDPRRYVLVWDHKPITEIYGLLHLHSASRFPTLEATKPTEVNLAQALSPRELEDDELAMKPEVLFEYIRLPASQVAIADNQVLDEMRSLGYAAWHETFDLILFTRWLPWPPDRPEATELARSLEDLDKAKFTLRDPADLEPPDLWAR